MHRWLMVVGVLLEVSACTKPNPVVCCASEGDCASIGISDPERGCALGLVCSDHLCSVPPDGPRAECTLDNECASPTPRCAPDLQCVECVQPSDCPVSRPTCDATTHECRSCTVDADCTSQVCDPGLGTCVIETAIVYAVPNGSSTTSCARMEPCSISRAFVVADGTRRTIKLAPGVYAANLVVANKSVDLRASGATISSTTGDTLVVNDGGSLTVSGAIVTSAGTDSRGFVCESLNNVDTPQLRLVDTQVESLVYGVFLSHCSASMLRTTIHDTGNVALTVRSASTAQLDQCTIRGANASSTVLATENSLVRLTNSIVSNPPSVQSGPIFAFGGCIILAYSTIINTTVTSASSPAICGGPTANGVCIENSVVANFSPGAPANTVTGAGCIAGFSIAFPQSAALAGPGNKGANPLFVNAANADFHLQLGSPAIDAADPSSMQMIDYSGKTRPQGSGRDMGAFEYP